MFDRYSIMLNPIFKNIKAGKEGNFIFDDAMAMAKKMNILKHGDLVVETAGTLSGVSGSTDLVKVGIVSSNDDNESLFI
mgnify:CR=1 FL=1